MRVMLASKWEERNESMFPFWAQPKLDGIRCIVQTDRYAYTRSMKPVRNEELQSAIRNCPADLTGLDGELIVGEPTSIDCYTRTSSAVMSYNNKDIENVTFWVFDIWNHSGNYDERYGELIERSFDWPDWIKIVPSALLSDMHMLNEYEQLKLEQGHEGVILRCRGAGYKFGRGTPKRGELIKLKRFEDAEGAIVDYHEKMHNSNPATINALGYTEHSGHKANLIPMETLGAIEVKLGSEWNSDTVRIGSGFDDKTRDVLWKDRKSLIGKIAKFKYFAVGTKDAPRFPIFLGLRDADDLFDI